CLAAPCSSMAELFGLADPTHGRQLPGRRSYRHSIAESDFRCGFFQSSSQRSSPKPPAHYRRASLVLLLSESTLFDLPTPARCHWASTPITPCTADSDRSSNRS